MRGKMIDTILMMNKQRWKEVSDKFFHNFDESLSFEKKTSMLFEVDDILKSFGLKYWLTNGTALGLVRDNQFIPWDDDLDIHVDSEDLLSCFGNLVSSLTDRGYVCRPVERGNTSKISTYKNNFKIAIGGIYLDGNFRKNKFRVWPKRFFENSIEYKIQDRFFNIPGPVDEYLSYIYKDWKTPLKSDFVKESFLRNEVVSKYTERGE